MLLDSLVAILYLARGFAADGAKRIVWCLAGPTVPILRAWPLDWLEASARVQPQEAFIGSYANGVATSSAAALKAASATFELSTNGATPKLVGNTATESSTYRHLVPADTRCETNAKSRTSTIPSLLISARASNPGWPVLFPNEALTMVRSAQSTFPSPLRSPGSGAATTVVLASGL